MSSDGMPFTAEVWERINATSFDSKNKREAKSADGEAAKARGGDPATTADQIEQARAFFAALRPHDCNDAEELVAMRYNEQGKGVVAEQVTFPAGDHDAVAREAVRLSELHRSVYITTCTHRFEHGVHRCAENAVQLHDLHADIDCRGGVHSADPSTLPTREEALAVVQALPIKPTALIDTRGGFQVWWALREPLDLTDAHERATAKALLTVWQGFIRSRLQDINRKYVMDNTADFARILRVAGTRNFKMVGAPPIVALDLDPGRRYNPSDFLEWTRPLKIDEEAPAAGTPRGDYPPVPLEPILAGCAWMRHCRDEQSTVPEPEWYGMLTILACCEGGADLAHEFSKGYPKYTEVETDQKYAHAGKGGPVPCLWVQGQTGDRYCKSCPARIKKPPVKSPVNLGTPMKQHTHGGTSTAHYFRTDYGLAERFVARHGENVRYCFPLGKWFVWEGHRWAQDTVGQVILWAKETARSIWDEAAACDDEDQRKRLGKFAATAESNGRIEAMLALARSEPGIAVTQDAFDADQWLFNTRSGTVDLRTGVSRPHRRDDLITKLSPAEFDPKAGCPRWVEFLAEILPDRDSPAFMQRALGYSLTGSTREQCLFFLYGSGANGKTTLLLVVIYVLGDYAKQAAPDLLLAKQGNEHPTALASLLGARFVSTTEVEEGRRFAEVSLKQLTGSDPISARFMRQDFFEFWPSHKLWLAANHKPIIRGTDHAIWRRVKLVPFTVTISEKRRDPELVAKLKAEAPGILAWMVEGCLAFQRDGLQPPEVVQVATDGYREEMDLVGRYLEERCVLGPHVTAKAGALYADFCSWCGASGEREMSQQLFGRRLKDRGLEQVHKRRERWWRGVGLVASPEDTDEGDGCDGCDGSDPDLDISDRKNSYHGETGRTASYPSHPSREREPGEDDDKDDPDLSWPGGVS